MTTLISVQWSNMFSYGTNNTLELTKAPLTQLVGLNGHGKSSVPLIIEELLYNANSKGTKRADVPNRKLGNGRYSGSVDFVSGRDQYRVEVQRSSTLRVKLFKNGVDISGHTSTSTLNTIKEILGKDRKAFSMLFYQNAASSLQFLTATDTQRKRFLIELRGLDKYVEIFETLKEQKKKVAAHRAELQGKVSTMQQWLDRNTKEDLSILPVLPTPDVDETLHERIATVKQKLSSVAADNKRIKQNNERISMAERFSAEDLLPVLQDVAPTSDVTAQIIANEREAKGLTDKVTKLKKLHDKCPTCLQSVSEEWVQKEIDSCNDVLNTLIESTRYMREAIKEVEAQNKLITERKKKISAFESIVSTIDRSLPSDITDELSLDRELKALQKELAEQTKALEAAQRVYTRTIEHNAKVSQITNTIDEYTRELKSASEALTEANTNEGDLDVLTKAFSTNGLISYIIEKSVQSLQNYTNTYLLELSQGRFEIEYSVTGDKLNVVIHDNGRPVEITGLSSGELARVTTATLLAIRKLMLVEATQPLNVLFLDETIDTLDAEGKDALIEVLLREHGLNVFIMSHGFSHPLVNKIMVVKEDEVSRLEEA